MAHSDMISRQRLDQAVMALAQAAQGVRPACRLLAVGRTVR